MEDEMSAVMVTWVPYDALASNVTSPYLHKGRKVGIPRSILPICSEPPPPTHFI